MADLLWSIPFIVTGWRTLTMPIDEPQARSRKAFRGSRLLVGTLCPMLITTGIFALAASVTSQHLVFGLSAIFVLLVIQGLQSGVLQLNYLSGQTQLLEREHDLKSANEALKELSQLDPLTSIPNRRRFDVALDETWRTGVRKKHSIALLIIDIDFFKGVNDLHGHPYGDQCIITVAQLLDHQAGRPYDLLARYGGDEFLLLLPDTGANGAATVADRIHAAVRALNLENRASPLEGRLTVSIGIGVVDAKAGVAADVLVDITDNALYEAKRLGRNQTFIQRL
jgi:diguanylate cyclase (GGDEF)-like protein